MEINWLFKKHPILILVLYLFGCISVSCCISVVRYFSISFQSPAIAKFLTSGHVFEAHEHFRLHCSQWQHFMHILCFHHSLSHLQLKVVLLMEKASCKEGHHFVSNIWKQRCKSGSWVTGCSPKLHQCHCIWNGENLNDRIHRWSDDAQICGVKCKLIGQVQVK